MASGRSWQDYMDLAIACPAELPFGTRIRVLNEVWECLDRGGGIVKNANGSYWIDMLTTKPRVAYGTELEATMFLP